MNLNEYLYEDPVSHEAAVDDYLAKLKAFLMMPDHGDGNWPAIKPEELSTAHELVSDMLQLKWGHDCDGDRPVRTRMWFRRTHRMVNDWALLELDPHADNEPFATTERRLLGNLNTLTAAMGSTAEELRRLQLSLDEVVQARQRADAAIEVYLVRYDGSVAGHSEDPDYSPVSVHLSPWAADTFVAEGLTVTRKYSRKLAPRRTDNPADNYAEFRARVAGLIDKVVSYNKDLLPILHG